MDFRACGIAAIRRKKTTPENSLTTQAPERIILSPAAWQAFFWDFSWILIQEYGNAPSSETETFPGTSRPAARP